MKYRGGCIRSRRSFHVECTCTVSISCWQDCDSPLNMECSWEAWSSYIVTVYWVTASTLTGGEHGRHENVIQHCDWSITTFCPSMWLGKCWTRLRCGHYIVWMFVLFCRWCSLLTHKDAYRKNAFIMFNSSLLRISMNSVLTTQLIIIKYLLQDIIGYFVDQNDEGQCFENYL